MYFAASPQNTYFVANHDETKDMDVAASHCKFGMGAAAGAHGK
jgi:hypothetical protein